MTRELGRGEGWGSRGGQARPADRPAADLSTPHLWALQPTKPDDPLLGMKFDAFPRPSSSSASPPTPSLSRLPNSNNLNRLRLPLAYVFRSPTSSARLRLLPAHFRSTIIQPSTLSALPTFTLVLTIVKLSFRRYRAPLLLWC